MTSGAIFDATGMYRYTLWREWNSKASRLLFIMLNPSSADATHNDPTIHRCLCFAQSWGYGSLEVVNLFAYRTAYPLELRKVADPIGLDNNRYLLTAQERADTLILAWGNRGTLLNRHHEVLGLLPPRQPLYCLGVTQSGQPRHPLYLHRNSHPLVFQRTGSNSP